MSKSKIGSRILLTIIAVFLTVIGVGCIQGVNHAQDQDAIHDESNASIECANKQIVNDQVVNNFINAYNKISPSPFTDIERGNISIKYFALSEGYWFELLDACDTEAIRVTINETNDTADQGIEGMKTVFLNVVKAIDQDLSEDEINSSFNSIVAGHKKREFELGKTDISFSYDMDFSSGHHRGWICVAAK